MTVKKQTQTIEQRVLKFIQHNHLIPCPQKVVVAVSGGPDSVCLLYSLYHLQTSLKISLYIAHLNHQLRGEESDQDSLYVDELAKKLDIPATIEKRNVTTYRDKHHLSLEEAAREVRYSFLGQVAESIGTNLVAVGHNLNDQIETILLHIIRGTGTLGLRGLQAKQNMQFDGRKLAVIRPLLEVPREEIEKYCQFLKLQPRTDSSNLSLSLLRNRIRYELVPLLKSYNPGISESILRIGSIAQGDQSLLESLSLQIWPEIVRQDKTTLIYDKEGFSRLAISLKRQLLRMGFEKLLGTLKDIETRHIEEVVQQLSRPAGRQITLPGGLVFSIEYDRYLLSRNIREVIPYPELESEYQIKVPGKTEIPGWTITARQLSSKQSSRNRSRWAATFDHDIVGDNIRLHSRQRGDTFQPLGMNQIKKVGEFMLDARIPREWRKRIPIFYTPHQVIWVTGYRIDERVKVTPLTKHVLILKIVRKKN
jgi:tRNA(Ile)-lysidine synthase